jgi:hypothetical protein
MPALAHDDLSRFRKLENARVLLSIFSMNSGYGSHVQHIYIYIYIRVKIDIKSAAVL